MTGTISLESKADKKNLSVAVREASLIRPVFVLLESFVFFWVVFSSPGRRFKLLGRKQNGAIGELLSAVLVTLCVYMRASVCECVSL